MTKSENIVSFPDLKVIEQEAAAWVARMDSRSLSASERSRFLEWVRQSSRHRQAIERMSAIWGGFDILDDLNYMDHEDENAGRAPETKQKISWIIGAVAASVMLAVGMVFYQTSGFFNQTQAGHFATMVGKQQTVELVDGSVIILNTNSKIDVNITPQKRMIKLIRGEAHFEVAPDSKRPFRVYAGSGVVEAVGTAFTVYLHKEAVEVTVTKGVVELLTQPDSDTGGASSDSAPEVNLTTVAALTAGQNAVFAEKIKSLEKMTKEELDRKLLWREGFIVFAGEPLSRVVSDISRYTNIIIEIEDPALENTPIGGHFKIGDVEGLFEALENIFGVQVKHVDASHVKLSRAV